MNLFANFQLASTMASPNLHILRRPFQMNSAVKICAKILFQRGLSGTIQPHREIVKISASRRIKGVALILNSQLKAAACFKNASQNKSATWKMGIPAMSN